MIAQNFPEAYGVKTNQLIAGGLALFVITLVVNAMARLEIHLPLQGFLGSQLMTTVTNDTTNPLTAGQLPKYTTWLALAGALIVGALIDASALGGFDLGTTVVVGAVIFLPVMYLIARVVEGRRAATDRLATNLVTGAFLLALVPLVSLLWRPSPTVYPASMRSSSAGRCAT